MGSSKSIKNVGGSWNPTPNHIIIDRGDEINNDGESNNNLMELNTSAEKEKKVNTYKKEINCLNEENRISDLKLILKKGKQFNNSKKEVERNKLNLSKNSSGSNSVRNNSASNVDNIDEIKKEENEELMEFDDHIEYKGKKLYKPFVEKPFNGDDHNIYILSS